MTDDRDLDRLLGLLAEEGRDQPDPAEHPSDGKLSFYHAGQLPPEEAESVREHLVECKRCRDLLLKHAEFVGEEDDAGEGREGVADFGAAADWRRVRERVGEELLGQSDRAYQPNAPRRFFASPSGGYSLAAVFFGISIGLGILYNSSLKESRRPVPLEEPRTLETNESFRGINTSARPETVQLPRQLILRLPREDWGPNYRIEFWQGDSLSEAFTMATEGSELAFFLPADALPPGSYETRVISLHPSASSEPWTYPIVITASSS